MFTNTLKKNSTKKNSTEIRWLQITAGLACLIGIGGLIALLSQGSWAADNNPRPGFQPGARTFNNPFANPTGFPVPSGKPIADESDDDQTDFSEDRVVQVPPPVANRPKSTVATNSSANSISMGGDSNPAGLVSHRDVSNVKIDDETGGGSKEVVTDFNFPDADIMDIARTLGKLTGKNFILDKDVKGRITIVSNGQITVGDAWRAFLTALDINQFALIPSGKYIRIARQRDARDKQLKTYTGDYSPDTDALITRVFSLKYINAEEVARTFRSFMPANSRIIPYEQTNTIIVTDTGSNIAKLAKMLEILDVEGFDAGIEVIPVRFASAVELSKLIDQLIPGTGQNLSAGQPIGAPRFGGGGSGFHARKTKEGGIINTILADERTNTLIIHANGKGAEQVRSLVTQLDKKTPATLGGGKVHVYYLQFAEAEAISATLNNLTSSSSAAGGGFRPVTAPGGSGTGSNPTAQSLFEGAIKVAPDKATNALVITASPSDYATVQRVINRLDIPRDEVYVEVVIMEVSLNKDFNFSSNFVNPASGGLGSITNASDLAAFAANPLASSGAIIPFAAGGQSSININGTATTVPSVFGLIKTLQTNSNGNVLATPQIIALDNTEANFDSTEKIPILTSTSVQGAGVSQSVTKEPVSLSIKIKPQINKLSNFVKLDVTAKLANIENRNLPSAVSQQAFATLERTAQTSVVVADGDTVVLGGLARDSVSDTVSKIPLLGDIPVLGWLFRSTTSHTDKTNLLIFMTPHIVRQYEKVRAILDKKLKERDDFIEENANGEDYLRGARDNLIRSLPDLKTLSQKPQASVDLSDDEKPAAPAQDGSPFTGEKARPTTPPGARADPFPAPPSTLNVPSPDGQPNSVEAPATAPPTIEN